MKLIIVTKYRTILKLTFSKNGVIMKCNCTMFALLIIPKQTNIQVYRKPEPTLKRAVKHGSFEFKHIKG